MKRVVVTGLGIVSPLGNTLEETWKNAIAGKSGVSAFSGFTDITGFEWPEGQKLIAGEVKNFDPFKYMSEREGRRNQRFVQLAVAATKMALEHANFVISPENHNSIGVALGVGVGGISLLEEQSNSCRTKGPKRVSPFTIPGFIANMAAGVAAIETGARGPNICTTTACTSSAHAIADAAMFIQTGRAKAMICGGVESALSPICFAGFSQMKALATQFLDEPERASRPWDAKRSGFVMGEGAGVLILEEYESAKQRGANILCEFAGFGVSGDAFHMSSPAPEGEGAARSMQMALETSGLRPEDIGYINAHGTATGLGDLAESQAIKTVFGPHAHKLNVSSTKSMTGHLLGGAGGVEAIFSVKALMTGIIPPTINLENPDPECDLNYTPNEKVTRNLTAVLSNSFGFGGTNCTLAFKKL